MVDDQARIILGMASRILSYPTDTFRSDQADIDMCIREEIDSEALRFELSQAIAPLAAISLSPWRLKELYVETFDLKEKAGLYLTAHELGDSRERGMALIDLRNVIREAGFDCRDDDLADYMPMLYELLSVSEEAESMERLSARLALATQRIRKHLADDNPYKSIFTILMDVVFHEPSPQDMQRLEQGREKPDLDIMPFPLMYR